MTDMIEVIPAILEDDFPEIEKKIRLVEPYVSWVQIDIADSTLVPNTTFLDPKPFSLLKKPVRLEVHMMVRDPLVYLKSYFDSNFRRFIAHIEGDNIDEFISKAKELGGEAGLSIDGPTPISKIRPYLDKIDVVLVMAVKAGFSGQPYREGTGEKIRKIKDMKSDLPIAVDGAMNVDNARKAVEAGATRINSNSYIFGAKDIKVAVESLKFLL